MATLEEVIDGLVSLAAIGGVTYLGVQGVTDIALHGTLLSVALGKPVVGKYIRFKAEQRRQNRREAFYPAQRQSEEESEGQ